ncbi:hypothetical protein AB0E11_13575 [Streptomyces fradiae]|uniref:hypothetical protein n=2 Tax=Streptomyces fradiae TaxID=1906 RepID=UPI0033E6C948
MDHQHLSAPSRARNGHHRRPIAAGFLRRAPQPQHDEQQRRAQALADARPSHAAALLAAIADQIGDRRTSHQVFTGDLWLRACSTGVRRVLHGLCEHTANNAVVIALTARPAPRPGETNGEYALRLRAAARSL